MGDLMLRAFAVVAFAVAVAGGSTNSASAALTPEPGAPVSGIIAAVAEAATVDIELDNPGFFQLTGATDFGLSILALSGDTTGVVFNEALATPPDDPTAAFADIYSLPADDYTLLLSSATNAVASFTVSEVPLPAGVVLLGTAVAGLAGYRRLRGQA